MSVCSMGRIPGGFVTNQVYSWVDPQGRSVSPPPDSHENHQGPIMEERTVSLSMDDGRSLGLMIRGGAEYGLGIYITGVDPGSAADAGALKVGDQILEVNGQSYITISHDEAVNILKTGRQLLMKVRDVGRLPHARTVVDETRWICSQTIAETNATASSHSSPNTGINPTINPTFNPVNNPCLNPGVTATIDSAANPSFNVVNSPCINPGVMTTINTNFNPVNNPCLNSGVSMTISSASVIDPSMNSLINSGVFNSVANSLINTGVNACSSRPTSARATPVLGKENKFLNFLFSLTNQLLSSSTHLLSFTIISSHTDCFLLL
ncbi:whirlin-like [Gouania willdenowi]|uniref:whirlin-like n=1 Tax=Gouania willdenowi TaxID=441366 RepID=UPI00105672FC|nr:whirlin-like [Gouania willdenowi]